MTTVRPRARTAGPAPSREAAPPRSAVARAAARPADEVASGLHVVPERGLSDAEADARRRTAGANAIASHRASALAVLWRQLRSPLLVLLVVAASVSFALGQRPDAVIIGVIVALSVCLGFGNEYRAERAAAALHSQVRHRTEVLRDGTYRRVDVLDLVPGDVVALRAGDVVPCDLRLLQAVELECDESILTGESLPVEKSTSPVAEGSAVGDLTSAALMGTVVHAGSGVGLAVATGMSTEFGTVAAGLESRELETRFQAGLRQFSMILVWVSGALTASIFVVNVALQRPLLDALLFSLAIAVGITPQLLPAVVSTSLAAGSRRMTRHKVLVKRLVCIEEIGDVDVLFTDKTGTLTDGRVGFARAIPTAPGRAVEVLRWGLLCSEDPQGPAGAVGGSALDAALWSTPEAARAAAWLARWRRVSSVPFSHETRTASVRCESPVDGVVEVVKGAPEAVLERCGPVPSRVAHALDAEFAAGNRVIALARRTPPEGAFHLEGLLVFLDPPKRGIDRSLARLEGLGVDVKLVTGDNAAVAAKVCADLGLSHPGEQDVLDGSELDRMDDATLAARMAGTVVFARVSPEQKARIVRAQRATRSGVAFLGDGVNDALALHAADVGISVDSATDVAKDAADVILLEKDLDVLADGVVEGRRIFANTIKYVMMGTSSNFGNMFSAAGASAFLSFLPMLPSQILLNNLLYDTSQLAIPTDGVDAEQLRRPSHWDMRLIRRFMVVFGPLSSVFDFMTFWVMLHMFHADPALFRSGWFVESLATQTLIIFAIRTRRVPFFRSAPSLPLAAAAWGVVLTGAVLPATPLAHTLGFQTLPGLFYATLLVMVAAYLLLVEVGKKLFFAVLEGPPRIERHPSRPVRPRRVHRRASRFSTGGRVGQDASHPAPGG
ncbi:magnesium-translocating P-type ATPase [Phycicoccus sp. M110.8]|uniref:magnesium-translocating P-type ATPase n=1 Tax=Phycicoccus sp. M110.8 TaxID=3075433 RepID=UPI0028FDB2EA|nr:magnesium-translocating P-type ATPase [Phycicoccus sp. M110.8]MDU0315404.1 magnesium-translocating P-type ATPase [Phycicoccus sp. M110.8]